jgi:hypothetical protein
LWIELPTFTGADHKRTEFPFGNAQLYDGKSNFKRGKIIIKMT